MKKIFYLIIPVLLLFVGCRKDFSTDVINESRWLSMERGVVVYSDYHCPFYVVETYNGYTVIRNWDGYIPPNGTVLYGDFSNYGRRTFYNRSDRYLTQLEVTDYWLRYWDAMDIVSYECGR